jgi:hypothetical protein
LMSATAPRGANGTRSSSAIRTPFRSVLPPRRAS